MKFETKPLGLIISSILLVITVPYTIYAWFDTVIPFSKNLMLISGAAIILFIINFHYYRREK